MIKLNRTIVRLLSTLIYIFVYWIVFYIGIDKLTFELSSRGVQLGDTHFASAKVVYDLFLINIVVSLLLAQIVAALNLYLSFKHIRIYKIFSLIHIPILLLFIFIIYKTEAVIPFIKNWHVAVFGTNYNVGGF